MVDIFLKYILGTDFLYYRNLRSVCDGLSLLLVKF